MNQNDICERFRQSASLRAAGVIGPEEEGRLREHLAVCEPCERRYREYDSLSQRLRQAYRDDTRFANATAVQRIISAIETARPERRCERPVFNALKIAAIAASVAAILSAVVVGIRWGEWSMPVAPAEAVRTRQGDPMRLASGEVRQSLPTLIELRAMLDRPEGQWESLLARGSRSISTPSLSLETLLSE
jgi:anti-sigma factor RsiW